MSFEQVETYLFIKGIELNDEDYHYDGGRLLLVDNLIPNEPMETRLIKWEFDIPKPTLDDLNKIDINDIEKMKNRKKKKEKLKRIRKSFNNTNVFCNIPVIDDSELLELEPYDGLLYINKTDERMYYYYNGKFNKVEI